MSSDNPVFLYKDILHVRISDHRQCSVETGPGVSCLTVSHGAFRNEGASGCYSPALAAIEKSDEEWVFFDWWTGSWAENTFRFQLQTMLREHPHMNGALFDEALAENGTLAFAADDSGFIYDYYGNVPSCILLRRDALRVLLENLHSLFPYPIQKLCDAARKAGVQLEKIHEVIQKQTPVQDHLIVPADRQMVLRGRNQHKKKLLVISHELSWTGAPLVLAEACISVLKPAGYEIVVLSPNEGPVSKKYLDNGISVMVLPEIASMDSKLLYSMVQPYDAVIVNTIVPYASIQILNTLNKPVLWWIHECEEAYTGLAQHLPQHINPNIHAYCVTQYAVNVLKQFQPNYCANILMCGSPDQNPAKELRAHVPGQRFRFATVGSIEHRKGQDILCEAISLLDADIRSQCEFFFAGRSLSSEILAQLSAATEKYPAQLHYLGLLPRDALDDIYPDMDCIICPSRSEPLGTFVVEGMSFGKPAICTENAGIVPFLRLENAGIVYSDNDPGKLAEAITAYVSLSDQERMALSTRARTCFDNCFTMDVFRENLLQVMDSIMLPATQAK